MATYANLVISAPDHIDGAHDLADRGDTGLDQPDGLFLQGPHALVAGRLADLVVRGAVHDQLADGVGDGHQLVDPGPLEEAGVRAEVAAGATDEPADRDLTAERVEERELLGGRL